MSLPSIVKQHQAISALIFFAILVLVFYGNTLGNGFVYDDHQQIEQNENIQSLANFPKIFTGCTWEGAFGSCKERGIAYYRPLQSLSYLITFQISSHPAFFHFVNLLYFFTAVSFLFFVGRMIAHSALFGFSVALIFLIHPLNSEAVNWISGVPELLLAVCMLASILFYLKDRTIPFGTEKKLPLFRRKNFLLSIACYFFAMLAKEPAVLLPAIFVILDMQFFSIAWRRLFTSTELQRYGAYAGAFFLYIAMRFFALGGLNPSSGFYESFSSGEHIHAFFTLFTQYIAKLIYPFPLLFYYSFEKSDTIFGAHFLISFLLVGAFVLLAGFALWKKQQLLILGGCLLVLFLLPVLIFLESLNEAVFAERYAFVPSIGFAFLAGYVITLIWRKHAQAPLAIGVTAFILCLAAFVTIQARNAEWKNDEVFYHATLAVNPYAYPIRFNLAVLLRNTKGDFEAAKQELETILQQKPDWRDNSLVYLHLGDYARDVGKNDTHALSLYMQSIEAAVDWKSSFAYDRIGSFYATREEYLNAIPYFCGASEASGPSVAASEERLGRAMDLTAMQYKKNPDMLFKDITQHSVFKKGTAEGVRYNRRTCEDTMCSLFFFLAGDEQDVILPFLIAGIDVRGDSVSIQDMARSPQGDQAMLGISSRYKDEDLTFIFPTCKGTYYEAPAVVES